MGAALLMSNLQATVRLLARKSTNRRELCSRLNRSISSTGCLADSSHFLRNH
jgi:hypothetical protein